MTDVKEIILTRKELYELVWKTPMRTLAKELGISDVALGKWCRKLDIPVPGRGYWAKIEAGQKVRKRKLPKPDLEGTLHLRISEKSGRQTNKAPRDVPAYEIFEQQPENRIVVADDLRKSHPLITQARRLLERGRPDYSYGHITPDSRPCLDIRVTKATLHQALRIMNSVVKALEVRGISVEVSGELRSKLPTVAIVNGEKIGFSIYERVQKGVKEDEYTKKKLEVLVPSGKLALRIHSDYYGYFKQIQDQKRKTLEERLNEFVIGLYRAAEEKKIDRAERERREREWEEERRRKEELRRQREAEAARRALLREQASNWCEAQQIREYVEAVESTVPGVLDKESASKLGEWLQWASDQADRLDPLVAPTKFYDRWFVQPIQANNSRQCRDPLREL